MNEPIAQQVMGAAVSRAFRRTAPRNAPARLPPPLGDGHNEPAVGLGLEGISKNARKRIAREKRLADRKKARKEERRALRTRKKQQRKAEREAMLRELPAEERERVMKERIQTMRTGRAEDRERRAQVKDILENHTRFAVCIDLGWNDQMYEKEQKSLARQLAYSYNAMRRCAENNLVPLSMSITGIDDVIKPVMTSAAQGWETWPIKLSEKDLVDTHSRENLVYLTHDADDVLQALDPDAVYVIGGIVDRNRLRCATMDKANQLGIKTARLNLDRNISLQHGTPVLTVNHCVEILMYAANGMSWRDAYLKVLPVRKGLKTAEVKQE